MSYEPSNMQMFYGQMKSVELGMINMVRSSSSEAKEDSHHVVHEVRKKKKSSKKKQPDQPLEAVHLHEVEAAPKKKKAAKPKVRHPSAMKSFKINKKQVYENFLEENKEESCPTCMDVSPNLKLECGHLFHIECIEGQINAKWSGPRITFGFLDCSMCRQKIKPASDIPLSKVQNILQSVEEHEKLMLAIEIMSMERAKEDELFKEENLEAEAFRQKVLEKVTCYMCVNCKKPYCGGLVDCAQGLEIDASKLTCQKCVFEKAELEAKMGMEVKTDSNGFPDLKCLAHGYKHAMFKCDSCCNIATWDCIYNHYCDRCHAQAGASKNYPCPGGDKCALGIKHPPNLPAVHCQGEPPVPFVIGCMKCIGAEIENQVYSGAKHMF